MRRSVRTMLVLLAAAALGGPAARAAPAPATLTFTTLGTNSGPIPRKDRSEPANLVRHGDQYLLADVGDGAAEQLAKAGVGIDQIQTVLISHLHFDHTGGLFAFLSLRFQTSGATPVTIYGPPGTRETVAHLFAAMGPGGHAIQTMRLAGGPDANIKIVEIGDGATFSAGEVRVTATENSHYVTLKSPAEPRPISLSFRFDAPGRSILYTGDTGPSAKVEQLCKGVDLLVSEMMDPALAIARIKVTRPGGPPAIYDLVEDHFRREHLSPAEVGKLATACGAKTVVATHNSLERDELAGARKAIAAEFKGRVVLAEDLQTF
ncbi:MULTISPECIES: MBL fold metallo-hydrolase [unclassified Phenylobacterium]|uniref:MBL fold metallo-hydrolase n=1 Tax=unclassified Phenylobacterium TaxID=2640670 RepID=UPI00083B5DF6|nr:MULTISPECIES: MBL fold metallo-hydrolase [unclassified Phenylobacterium]